MEEGDDEVEAIAHREWMIRRTHAREATKRGDEAAE